MMLQISSGIAFVIVLVAYAYFLFVIYPKQKHEAKIRNGLAGTRRNLYKTGRLFVLGAPLFLIIFFQRMTGLYFIPAEYLSPVGTLLLASSVFLAVYWAGMIYPVRSFTDWIRSRWW